MKKYLLIALSLIICTASINSVFAAKSTTANSKLAEAIKFYKAKNYTQSYLVLTDIIEKDSSNAAAYYYLAMTSAQMGKKSEAIENYAKVLELNPNLKLARYAEKGKRCLESPERCHEEPADSQDEQFIRGKFGSGFSEQARSEFERQRIENLKREMNRNNDITPRQFKDYRDFSSEVPTNDEIVAALRVLQKAGLSNGYSDLSTIANPQYNELSTLLGTSGSNMSPQLIQALLSTQMTSGF